MTFTVFGLSCGNSISAQCGKETIEQTVPTSFIKGGTASKHWPWLVALIYKKSGDFFCRATLISMKTALTAAHCIQQKYSTTRLNPTDVEVYLGRHNLSDSGELNKMAKVLEIVKIAMHPDWDPKNFRYDADIALLIASKEVERSSFISPICLPNREIQKHSGIIVGWGFSNDEKRKTEDIPRQAEAEKVPLIDCLLVDNDLVRIASKRTFCVKGVAEGSGPCKGDSGNRHKFLRYYLILF